ncbi:MAG: hypothetical protein JF563_04160, partial [Acidobacteriales bacterium]|nr:hypothetical protein [Terriglobales bacterium]
LVDQYFNGSTGNGNEGDTDMHGPWQSSFGLTPVDSQVVGGRGLDIKAVNGKLPGEDRGKQDAAKAATTAPEKSELIGIKN